MSAPAMPLADADDPRVPVVAAALRQSAAAGAGTFTTDARRVLAALDQLAPDDGDPQRLIDAAVVAYLDAPRDAAGHIGLEELMRHIVTALESAR